MGIPSAENPLRLLDGWAVRRGVEMSGRIGVSRGADWPLRFYLGAPGGLGAAQIMTVTDPWTNRTRRLRPDERPFLDLPPPAPFGHHAGHRFPSGLSVPGWRHLVGPRILAGGNPALGLVRAIEPTVAVLSDPGDAKVILFTLVIGALIATIESSGGVRGFVGSWRTGMGDLCPAGRLLAWMAGVTLFIESNINVLVAGSVSRPLFDRFKTSREKLAYIIDSASAPTCIMIPLNAWGAYNLGILSARRGQTPCGSS